MNNIDVMADLEMIQKALEEAINEAEEDMRVRHSHEPDGTPVVRASCFEDFIGTAKFAWGEVKSLRERFANA
jgi:hypothetical protein